MSVLDIDKAHELHIDTQTLVGRSVAVLGITGSGKTNTTAVLIEELLSNGIPITIVDIEGEYWGLKEKYQILVAGRSDNVDIEVGSEHAGHLAELSVRRGVSVILDLSEFTQTEMQDFLINYFIKLWEVCNLVRKPYEVVLEEAHEFVPQGTRTPLKEFLTRIALRGRKRGLGIIMISQRSAKVEKDVLTQASMMFLHRVIHPTDLKVYQDLIPLPARQVDEMVGQLQLGQAVVVFNNEARVVDVRLRYTFHAGATPVFENSETPKLRKIDSAVINEFKKLASATSNTINSNRNLIEKDIKTASSVTAQDWEKLLAEKDAEIKQLRIQLDKLSQKHKKVAKSNSTAANGDTNASVLETNHNSNKTTYRTKIGSNVPTSKRKIEDNSVQLSKNQPVEIAGRELTPVEELKLKSITDRLRKLSKLQRAILRTLSEQEGASMNIATLATWLGLSENSVRSHPPLDLIKMGLITRKRGSNGYRYTSSLQSFLLSQFPNIEPKNLYKVLFL